MRALLLAAALVALCARDSHGFFGYGEHREASRSYYEAMNHCDLEGGECIDVDFNTPPAPTPAPTLPPTLPPFFYPPTHAPAPIFIPLFWPTTRAPPATTRAPPTTTRAPPTTTRAPPTTTRAPLAPMVTTLAPVKTTLAPVQPNTAAPKRNARKQRRRNQGEREIEVRKRRAIRGFADPFEYLYTECSGGWEFDLSCGVRGNVCCYSSSGNNY